MARSHALRMMGGVLVLVAAALPALAGPWTVTRLTYTGLDKHDIVTDGSLVAWTELPSLGADEDVFVYEGGAVTRLTDDAWVGSDGHDDEVWLYDADAGTVLQLTDNDANADYGVCLDGDLVAWVGPDPVGGDSEIFLHNAATGVTTQVTENAYGDTSPALAGRTLAWLGVLDIYTRDVFMATVPGPGTLGLLAAGLAVLARRRR